MEWISVKDRLPEDEAELLVHGISGDGSYYVRASRWIGLQFRIIGKTTAFPRVLHWQPLPPPPNASTGRSDT